MQIIIAGNRVNVFVKQSNRSSKIVKAEIKSKNRIIVTTPTDIKVDVDAFLKKHRNILEKKYKQFIARKPIFTGNLILYKGEYRILVFRIVEKRPKEEVILSENMLSVFHEPRSDPYLILKRWLTRQARQLVDDVKKKYKVLRNPLAIRVADTKRWGYIRKNGVIVINWQVICLPLELLEYIVVHELVHLEAFNHQKEFHRKLSEVIPDYKKRVKNLRRFIIEHEFGKLYDRRIV